MVYQTDFLTILNIKSRTRCISMAIKMTKEQAAKIAKDANKSWNKSPLNVKKK